MQLLRRAVNLLVYLLVAIVILAAVGSRIAQHPFLLTVVRSYSMYPLLRRGDVVLLAPLSTNSQVQLDDVILFRTEGGRLASEGWIIHRVIDGDENGYITKGDNNPKSDQDDSEESVPIKREWVAANAIKLGGAPVKIPLLGYIPLWAGELKEKPGILVAGTVVAAIALVIVEMRTKRKNRMPRLLQLPLVYLISGLVLSVVTALTMLASSQYTVLTYGVSSSSTGVLMGSTVGILQVGQQVEKPLADVQNKNYLPFNAVISCKDQQVSFEPTQAFLMPRETIGVRFMIDAQTPGQYESPVWMALFIPVLPLPVVAFLARIDFWLALTVVSIVPGLPFVACGLLDRHFRHYLGRGARRLMRKGIMRA